MTKRHVFDGAWLLALVLYTLAGTPQVPFHGDESTVLWMSKDYAYIIQQDNLDRVRYSESPVDESEQHLRLANGALMRYLVGLSWSLDGHTIEDINEQWHWGFDWNWNLQNGHAPSESLLVAGRWPSALMLAASVVVLFVIGTIVGGRPIAYLASAYFVLNPALLLNGRRAMFEGGLMLFSLLVVLMGIMWLRGRRPWAALALGVAAGLAVSMKHPGLLTVAPVFAAVGVAALITYRASPARGWRELTQVIGAGILSLVVFWVLNPVWWGNPIERIGQVVDARVGLLDNQIALFGGYDDRLDQFAGFLRQTFVVEPQYFEVSVWQGYIGNEIERYEATPWSGLDTGFGWLGGALIAMFTAAGCVWLWRKRTDQPAVHGLIGLWVACLLLSAWLLTPLEWQRYYLMTYPAVGLVASIGLVWAATSLSRLDVVSQRRTSSASESLR